MPSPNLVSTQLVAVAATAPIKLMQGSVKQNWLPGQPRVAHLFLISFINTDGTCTCSHVIPLYHKPIAGKDGELEQLLAVSLLPAAGI